MYALFVLLLFVPLFGLDSGYSLSKEGTVFSAQQANVFSTVNVTSSEHSDLQQVHAINAELAYSNSLSFSSNPLSFPTFSFSAEVTNLNTSVTASNKCNYGYLFPEILALYLNGHAQELVKEANGISMFTYINNPTLRMKKDYINSLIKGENKQHLEHLVRLAGIDTPRRMRVALDAYFQKTKDPLRRCHAVILADKASGGGNFIPNIHLPKKEHIPADGNPGFFVDQNFLVEIRQDASYAQEAIDVEMAKYTLERYLSYVGSSLTLEITQQYLKEMFYLAERIPCEYQKTLIFTGIHGFYSKFIDPKATIRAHKDTIHQVSQKLIEAITKESGKLPCVPTNIVDLTGDIHELVNYYSRDELIYKAGQRVSDAIYDYVDKMTLMREKRTTDQQVAPNASEIGVSPVVIQPESMQEHGIFCDAMIAPEKLTDFCISGPSNIINISPEIDAQIQQRLSQLSVEERQHLDQLSDSVGSILFEMHQAGELTPAALDENAKKLCSYMNKITLENASYVCARIARAQKNRITDPKAIVSDYIQGTYAVSRFVFDMYFGQYYMSDKQQIEHFENTLKVFTETVDGFKSMTMDQVFDLMGAMSVDVALPFGVSKTIGWLRKIGVASKVSSQCNRIANALERQFAQSGKHLVIAEGVVLDCPKELSIESLALKHSTDKTIAKVPANKSSKTVLKNFNGRIGKAESTIKYTFSNGVYKDAPYHTSSGNSIKSARPTDGQHALDNSFKISDNSTRRITLSNNQFVVLDETLSGEFHGHVREWNDLTHDMQRLLIKNRLAKPNGKIIE